MHVWLQGFAYQVSLNPLLFPLAGFAALAIALATVAYIRITINYRLSRAMSWKIRSWSILIDDHQKLLRRQNPDTQVLFNSSQRFVTGDDEIRLQLHSALDEFVIRRIVFHNGQARRFQSENDVYVFLE